MSAQLPIDWHWVRRLAAVLLALAVMPVILGVLLDRRLHTFPILTLCMMFVGLNLGILAIARRVAAIYAQLAPDKKM